MDRFTVNYERDESGWWIATVPEIEGCVTQGRTLEQARSRVREAIDSCFDDDAIAANAELIDNIKLPVEGRKALRQVAELRKKTDNTSQQLSESIIATAKLLTERFGLTLRDAGELLGLSHQRVHQILENKPATKSKQLLNDLRASGKKQNG